jgi:NAD(P)H-quinone oxidoreductase subunit 4
MIVPIIAVGLYPKLVTQTYDVKTVAVAAEIQESITQVAQARSQDVIASQSLDIKGMLSAHSPSFHSGVIAPAIPR